jgi:hypothetical protein
MNAQEGIQLTKIWESCLAGAADVIRDTIYRLREYLEVTGLKTLIDVAGPGRHSDE